MPSGLAVAAITTAGYAGILICPAGVGFVAKIGGLPMAFWDAHRAPVPRHAFGARRHRAGTEKWIRVRSFADIVRKTGARARYIRRPRSRTLTQRLVVGPDRPLIHES